MTTRLARVWHPPRPLLLDALGHLTLGAALAAACGATLYPLLGAPIGAVGICLLAYAVVAGVALFYLPQHQPNGAFGPANRLTLLRGAVAAFLAGLIGQSAVVQQHGWPLLGAALAALILDGFDGYAARRRKMTSSFGARFDMEIDSLMILVLAALAWTTGKVGPWILITGGMRYLFAAAAWLIPLLDRPLPPSKRRQTVCVVQIVALFLILIPQLPAWVATALGALSIICLIWSFAVDIRWLVTRRPRLVR